MFNLENFHRNKKLAFLDGLLCGALIAVIVMQIVKDRKETRELFPPVD